VARLNDRTGKAEVVPKPADVGEGGIREHTGSVESTVKEIWGGKLSRPSQEKPGEVQRERVSAPDPFGEAHPALVSFVRDSSYSDGTRRTPGSIVVFVQDYLFTLCFTDKTQQPNLVAFQAARTLTELFSLAEAALRSDSLHWRVPARSRGR